MSKTIIVLATPQPILTWAEWLAQPQSQVAIGAFAISTLGFVVALISAISSARSAGTAKKNLSTAQASLQINLDSSTAANRELKVDFTNAVFLRGASDTTYVFDVQITNPATRPNTVVGARLTLLLAKSAPLIFDPSPLPIEMKEKIAMILPLAVDASGQKTGSLSFVIPYGILDGRAIERFRLSFIDSSERVTAIDTISITGFSS